MQYFVLKIGKQICTVITQPLLLHGTSFWQEAIVLLDEYDTPLQEANVNGYWQELVSFTRGLFNSTFKINPYLERGLMTGITRVSRGCPVKRKT